MKSHTFIKIFFFIIAALTIFSSRAIGQEAREMLPPRVLIVYDTPASPFQMAMAEDAARAISKTFNRLGRFLPIEQNVIDNAQKKFSFDKANDISLRDFAAACGADIYVSLSFAQNGKTHSADIKIRALRDEWKFLEKSRRVQSKIPINIPLMLSKEIAISHKKIPVTAKVLEIPEEGFARISAGEWNGIAACAYTTDKGIIQVVQTGKYQSIVKSEHLHKEESLTLHAYPDISAITAEFDVIILHNTIKTYAIAEKQLKNDNDELRCLSATCVINPGGSFCLGGYGAFLSTYYVGFQNPAPAIDGIVISSMVYAAQLLLIPGASMFQLNFFPWVRDSDKTRAEQHLHIFLWATIPLTFSAAFFDQLAYQCHRSEVLPPFFLYGDNTAAFLSAIIPGGGLFFKGYRYTGWIYFLSEMAMGSYAAYHRDDEKNRKYALMGIAAIKALEILHAYFVKPSYAFFTSEVATGSTEMIMHATVLEHPHNEVRYQLGMRRWF